MMDIPDSAEAVRRWLPEIWAIQGDLREETIEYFVEDVPDYFWLVRAAQKHHPHDHRGKHGLVIHTKRTLYAWLRIERMLRQLSLIDPMEANCARMASLTHDTFQYGKPSWATAGVLHHQYATGDERQVLAGLPEYADDEHGSIAAEMLAERDAVPEQVLACARTHNGGFGDDPNPEDILELGHHLADAFASDVRGQYRVYDPEGVLTEQVRPVEPTMTEVEFQDMLGDI